MRARFPALHRLAIGDLSEQRGGWLSGHRSHQSGRDADLGLYYRHRPRGYPLRFAKAHRGNLHFRATWQLLRTLAQTRSSPTGAEWVLLDYRIQGLLYDWARGDGISQAVLQDMLQYPRGRRARVGFVRHFPAHDDHLHVRFKCPAGDRYCR